MFLTIQNALNDGMFRIISAEGIRAIKMPETTAVWDTEPHGHSDNYRSGIFKSKISKVAIGAPQDPVAWPVARDRRSHVSFAPLNPVRLINNLMTS